MSVDLRKEIWIDAAPRIVFEFLTQPAKLGDWLANSVVADPVPGGRLELTYSRAHVVRGEFAEVIPCQRVVFRLEPVTGVAVDPPSVTVVEITLRPEGAGTKLVLVQTGTPAKLRPMVDQGWRYHFERLASVVAGRTVGRNTTFDEAAPRLP